MTSGTVTRIMVGFYILLFFGYLFGPLIMMGASAFNAAPNPQVSPWEGFTLQWFGRLLSNDDMMSGIKNSVWIGLGPGPELVPEDQRRDAEDHAGRQHG